MVTKIEKEKQELKAFKEISGILDFFAYLFRYRMKELLALVVILLIGYILASNISYNQKDGWSWNPSVRVNVEVKK